MRFWKYIDADSKLIYEQCSIVVKYALEVSEAEYLANELAKPKPPKPPRQVSVDELIGLLELKGIILPGDFGVL